MTTTLGMDIKRTYWSAETVYGTTTTGALKALGETMDLQTKPNFNPEEDEFLDRAFTSVAYQNYEVGFTLTAKVWLRDGVIFVPEDFWALYALGEITGRASDGRLDSFSLVSKKTNATITEYALFNGCVVDGLTIQAGGVGKALVYSLDCRAQYVVTAASKAFTGLQTITPGADPTLPTTAYARWDGTAPQVNYGSGLANIAGVIDWKVTIKNNLTPEWYKRTGADALVYPVAEAFDEGDFDCTVDISRWHRDNTHWAQKLARKTGIIFTLYINGKTWTFTGGYFKDPSAPDHKSGKDPLKETLSLKFNGLTIA
jgi:hypothetical protein